MAELCNNSTALGLVAEHVDALKERVQRCLRIAARCESGGGTRATQLLAARIEADLDQVIAGLNRAVQ